MHARELRKERECVSVNVLHAYMLFYYLFNFASVCFTVSVHVCVRPRVCVRACALACVCVHTHVCMHVCASVCVHMCAYVQVCMHMCLCMQESGERENVCLLCVSLSLSPIFLLCMFIMFIQDLKEDMSFDLMSYLCQIKMMLFNVIIFIMIIIGCKICLTTLVGGLLVGRWFVGW